MLDTDDTQWMTADVHQTTPDVSFISSPGEIKNN